MLFRNGKAVVSEGGSKGGDGVPLEALAEMLKKALGESLAEEVGKVISEKLAANHFSGQGGAAQEEMSEKTMNSIAAAMSRIDTSDIESSTDKLGEESEVKGDKESNRRIIDKLKDL